MIRNYQRKPISIANNKSCFNIVNSPSPPNVEPIPLVDAATPTLESVSYTEKFCSYLSPNADVAVIIEVSTDGEKKPSLAKFVPQLLYEKLPTSVAVCVLVDKSLAFTMAPFCSGCNRSVKGKLRTEEQRVVIRTKEKNRNQVKHKVTQRSFINLTLLSRFYLTSLHILRKPHSFTVEKKRLNRENSRICIISPS